MSIEAPTVKTSIRDPESQITYHVMAYRKLTREELVLAVQHYHDAKKRKPKYKPGTVTTIVTIIGANE